MPLQRRVPKFGFKNINRVEYKGSTLILSRNWWIHKISEITLAILAENGLVSKNDNVKILGSGELKAKLKITAHAFSATAKAAVEAAGGSAELINA
jgi:large subunit ribosomal protein L15